MATTHFWIECACIISMCWSASALSKQFVEVRLGEEVVEICCPGEHDSAAPVWQINDTIYISNQLSNDYYISINSNQTKCYQFTILHAKLWMNATTYSCYYSNSPKPSLYFTLLVSFEFKGPSIYTPLSDNKILLYCYISQINLNESSIFWSINETIYNPIALPKQYTMNEEGLKIFSAKNTDYITFQCLIYSSLLYKDHFLESEIANISTSTISFTDGNTDNTKLNQNTEPLPVFSFIYQEFLLLNSSKRIEWKDATSCGPLVSYSLVKELGSIVVNVTKLGPSNLAFINSNDLMSGSQYYSYHVEADNGNNNCMISDVKLQMSPTLTHQTLLKYPNQKLVVNISIDNVVAIWPITNGSYDSCMCPVFPNISRCSCISEDNDNVYNVTNNDVSVSWNNLPNNTKIYFITQDSDFAKNYLGDSQYLPTQMVHNAYEVILVGPPEPPTITSSPDNPYELCFVDNYDGHSPILQYFINVTDNTEYTYSSSIKYTNGICKTIPLDPSICGQITIKSQSTNEIGNSKVDATILNQEFHSENKCQCFNQNVKVHLQDVMMTTNDVTLNVSCETPYNMKISDIHFAIKLTSLDIVKAEVQAKCFDQVTLPNLDPKTVYMVKLSWKQECPELDTSYSFTTLNAQPTMNSIIIYAGFGSALGLLTLVILIMAIVFTILWCRRKITSKVEVNGNN